MRLSVLAIFGAGVFFRANDFNVRTWDGVQEERFFLLANATFVTSVFDLNLRCRAGEGRERRPGTVIPTAVGDGRRNSLWPRSTTEVLKVAGAADGYREILN